MCAVFDALAVDTNIRMERFQVFEDTERLQKYFPPQVKPGTMVEHGTGNRLFVLISEEIMPEMTLTYYRNRVGITAGSRLEDIHLEGLYARPEASPPRAPGPSSVLPT